MIGAVCSFFALINGSKMGLPALASCLFGLFLSLGVHAYAKPMAIGGAILSAILLLVTVLTKTKAIEQIVKGVQLLKHPTEPYMEDNEVLKEQQDKTTQKIVKKVKANLKKKGEI
jgi:hypothetical protein